MNQEIEIKHLEASDQTTDHLLYECELLKTQRHSLNTAVSKSGLNVFLTVHHELTILLTTNLMH